MTMDQTIQIAARLRMLDDREFGALRVMLCSGVEPQDERMLAVLCDALADCADLVRRSESGPSTDRACAAVPGKRRKHRRHAHG